MGPIVIENTVLKLRKKFTLEVALQLPATIH